MPSDVRIYTGSAWESIKGPKGDTGATGPSGPTVVSADAGQLAKLGTDGRILVASADLDSRFVNVSGDTVTGTLLVSYPAARFWVTGTGVIVSSIYSTDGNAASLNVSSGTNTGQLQQASTQFIVRNLASGGFLTVQQAGAGTVRFLVDDVQSFSVNSAGATAMALTVTGNISSDGTAHTFKAASIPAAAISGLDSIATAGLKAATASVLGGVKVGANLSIDAGGVLSATAEAYSLPAATASVLGGVKVGANLSIDGAGVLSASAAPAASAVAGAALAASGVVGVSTAYARADHSHPFPTAANVGALALTGGTVTGLVSINYAAAQLMVGGTGNTTATIRSTDGGSTTLNISSGTNSGQFNQNGTAFTFTNYASGGTLRFNQSGAGLVQFFANGIKALELSGTVATIAGNINATGTAHTFANNSIPAAAIKDNPIAVQVLTQAAYDAIATKSATTLYLISG